MPISTSIEAITQILSVLQFIGIVLVFGLHFLPRFTGPIISICGFATFLKAFLPTIESSMLPIILALVFGSALFVAGCLKAEGVWGK